jgi:hypothetical protein
VSTDDGASDGQAVFQIVLGLLFLALAVNEWRKRPAPGTEPEQSKLLEKVKTMGPAVALGLGVVLTAVNPKNLALILSAAGEIATVGLDGGELAVVAAVFTLITMIGVAAPVVVTVAMGDRSQHILGSWQEWLAHHNAAVMIAIFAILAAKMLGSGIAALSA